MEFEITGNPEVPGQQAMRDALEAYVARTNAGDAPGLVALFAPGATIEDPVGTRVKQGADIAAWFADSVAFETRITPIAPIRGSFANEAALVFDVEFTPPDSARMRVRSLDICTFDGAGRITSLRACWGPEDIGPA